MAKLLDPLKRRDMLYGKNTSAEVLREYGDLYLNEGKPNDAVEFFGQACYKEGLQRIRQMAIEEGDLFIFPVLRSFCKKRYPSMIGGR